MILHKVAYLLIIHFWSRVFGNFMMMKSSITQPAL